MHINLGYKCEIAKKTHSICHNEWNTKRDQKYHFFRLQIAILHFSENSDREQATLQDSTEQFNIAFPKCKKVENTAKKIFCEMNIW